MQNMYLSLFVSEIVHLNWFVHSAIINSERSFVILAKAYGRKEKT